LGTFTGCLFGVILLSAVAIGAAYWLKPQILPWVEKQGRVLLGGLSNQALRGVLNEAGMHVDDKNEWRTFLKEKWELASYYRDEKLSRSVYIEAGRAVVESESGIYYALAAFEDRTLTRGSLTPAQITEGRRLIKVTRQRLAAGAYSSTELDSLRSPELHGVASGLRSTGNNDEGEYERDENVRDFLRALMALDKQGSWNGDGKPRDMRAAFAAEMERFKETILADEASRAVPEQGP